MNHSPVTHFQHYFLICTNLQKYAYVFQFLHRRSFSQMKLIKNRLRNRLNELSLSNLMKIAIESPKKLMDSALEELG